MNLLAFAFHTARDCLETLWQSARQALRILKRATSWFPPTLGMQGQGSDLENG
jgi:hypothetical protein